MEPQENQDLHYELLYRMLLTRAPRETDALDEGYIAAMNVLESNQISPNDTPEQHRQKYHRIYHWWKDKGRHFHHWWRIWSAKCPAD